MNRKLKYALVTLACLVVFQMFFRYDIRNGSDQASGIYMVYDRLTGKIYQYKFWVDVSLFPWPHENK